MRAVTGRDDQDDQKPDWWSEGEEPGALIGRPDKPLKRHGGDMPDTMDEQGEDDPSKPTAGKPH